jgi:hypothetical protein
MTEITLTQFEADFLFKMEKHCTNNDFLELPDFGGCISVPLASSDKKENFLLDVSKGKIDLKRQKFQNRAKDVIILARLDLGSPHRNPDGEEIGVPHLHLYREGFNDKWAYELPDIFTNIDDFWTTLQDFMKFCNVTKSPNFRKSLFS